MNKKTVGIPLRMRKYPASPQNLFHEFAIFQYLVPFSTPHLAIEQLRRSTVVNNATLVWNHKKINLSNNQVALWRLSTESYMAIVTVFG